MSLQDLLDRDIYRTYLNRLDARAMLEHYGAEHCSEQYEPDGTIGILHSCLLDRVEPHHSHGDESPSAYCNLDKKLYVCYALGFGCDLMHLIMKLEGKESFTDALGAVGEFLTGARRDAVAFREELEKAFAARSLYHVELPVYSERVLDVWNQGHPYWTERGVTEDAIRTLRLGYDAHEHRVVFPLFVNQKLVGWQKRVIPAGHHWHATTPSFPKYRNSSGFPKSETLYNLDSARQYPRVCVVESPMSVARAVSLGIPNVVATFGAKVSNGQIDLLINGGFKQAYIWFDADGAGYAGERKLLEGLYRHMLVEVVTPDGGKDMGDSSLEEITEKLAQAVPARLKKRPRSVRRQ